MNKNNMDWKSFAETLLWYNIVHDKNGDSLFDIMLEDGPEGRGIKRGDIGHWRIQSYLYPGSHTPLTWKGLALALGLYEDHLTHDGHDCKNCPNRKDCLAYFKDDTDHERCYWWEENMDGHEETKGNDK